MVDNMTFGVEDDDHLRAPSDTCPGITDDPVSTAARQYDDIFLTPLESATSVSLLDTAVSGRIHQGFAPSLIQPADIRLTDTQPIAASVSVPQATDTVYVLRRHRRHLVVGTLLSHTPRTLTNHQAQSWATRQATTGTTLLLPWKLFDEADPDGGWHTTSGLLVDQYALYRHLDGWHLLGAVTRVPRRRIATDDDAKAWAADVLNSLAPLSWAYGPVTEGTTIWYATPWQ